MRYNKYRKPTVELLLKLLSNAYDKNEDLDKILYQIMEQAGAELADVIRELERRGKLNMGQKIDIYHNPEVFYEIYSLERGLHKKMEDYANILVVAMTSTLIETYQITVSSTYDIFSKVKRYPYPKVEITNNYIKNQVLNIPWCQDGKTYSQRIYNNVANFESKLRYVLQEGITNGRGIDWMTKAWRKLTGSSAYDTARLLKTETVAMWSQATKETYLSLGIEYVEITGDAECGGICLDYVGEAIPLRDAELGDLLPPYHPNCACSYVAYTEDVPVEEANEEDFYEAMGEEY